MDHHEKEHHDSHNDGHDDHYDDHSAHEDSHYGGAHASSHAESSHSSGHPDGHEYEDNLSWIYSEIALGLAMGMWGPITSVAYDGSCYNMWYNFGINQIKWHKFYDSEFHLGMDLHGAIFVFEIVHLVWELYEIAHVCGAQYQDLHHNEYLDFLGSHFASPVVRGGDSSMEGDCDDGHESHSASHYIHLTLATVGTFVHGYEAVAHWNNQYYWMLFGIDTGKALAHVPVLL